MKRLKWFKVFENSEFSEAASIIMDYKSEFTDLGYDMSKVSDVGSYQVNLEESIPCLRFGISTPLDTQFMLVDCYDVLDDLHNHLKNACDLELSIEIYEDMPMFDLHDAYEIYAGSEWSWIGCIVHKPIDR